jgi:hypothetical protein
VLKADANNLEVVLEPRAWVSGAEGREPRVALVAALDLGDGSLPASAQCNRHRRRIAEVAPPRLVRSPSRDEGEIVAETGVLNRGRAAPTAAPAV